jgi:hypothetical protein
MRRVKELRKKYEKSGTAKPALCAIANALNSLWAIDICSKNVDMTRKRVFEFILQTLHAENISLNNERSIEFIAHVICAIEKQIFENEALSSIGTESSASQTKVGREWIKKNKHHRINFENTWCHEFSKSSRDGAASIQFRRALKFVTACVTESTSKATGHFGFATSLLKSAPLFKSSIKIKAGIA